MLDQEATHVYGHTVGVATEQRGTEDPEYELLVFQSMWGMEQLPGKRGEWAIEEQVHAILDAGFDGVQTEIPPYDKARETLEALAGSGRPWVMEAFPATVNELESTIEAVVHFGAERCHHIDLQANIRPHTVLECIPYVLGWQRLADEAGIPLYFETHRDRMTTDLLFTLQLIDAVPSIRLVADLSHYLVGREFGYPVSEENHGLIHRILDRAEAMHGRVASREQVQISFEFPQHRQWLDLFLEWWEEGFRRWRARASGEYPMPFTIELGPPPYAITGADGAELSDRWDEALALKDLVRERWGLAMASAGSPAASFAR
jgi:hypothetical protein